VEVGAFAHGGHCVARLPAETPEVGGTVVFVRHALPGERVTVRVTSGSAGDRFLRGDAVAVLRASEDRVMAPCRYAGPGRCGGCDLQHVSLDAQRRLKAGVVAEQLRRLAGLDLDVEVEPVPGLPGRPDGLRWRTRMRYHRAADGRLGLRRHRSRDVIPLDDCLIQAPAARVTVDPDPRRGVASSSRNPAESSHPRTSTVTEHVHGRPFEVGVDGFWQVHAGAPEALVDTVLDFLQPRPGEAALDLYGGVGLFAVFLAEAVGPRGSVGVIEGDRLAAELCRGNTAAYPWVRVTRGPVDRVLARRSDRADIVVLDPPRTGARRPAVEAVADRRPRAVAYVACDPASFARDVAIFGERGYVLSRLRALDLFPMTHHVECIALVEKTGSDLR
jgi:tRNA/tmRNA/rRNA uracil-C5-methylase (TrmA/RlmC/RlmD family)